MRIIKKITAKIAGMLLDLLRIFSRGTARVLWKVFFVIIVSIGLFVFFGDPNTGYVGEKIDLWAETAFGEGFQVNGEYGKGFIDGGFYVSATDVVLPWPIKDKKPKYLLEIDELRIGVSVMRLASARIWKYFFISADLEENMPLVIKGWVSKRGNDFAVDIKEASYAGSRVVGHIEGTVDKRKYVDKMLDVRGNIDFKRLNVEHLFLLSGLRADDVEEPKKPKSRAHFNRYNADIVLNAENLYFKNVKFGSIKAHVVMDRGRMTASVEAAELSSGILSGEIMVDMARNVPRMEVDLDLTGFDYGQLVAESGFGGEISGKLDLDVDLESRATQLEPWDLFKRWTGKIKMIAHKGRIMSSILDFWAQDLLISVLPIPGMGSDHIAELNCAVVDLRVKDGKGKFKTFLLDTSKLSVVVDGKYNFISNKIDIVLRPKAKDIKLIDLATPVRIKGPIKKPSVTPELFGTIQKVGEIALTVVNPLALVIPTVKAIITDHNPCVEALEQTVIESETAK